MGTIVVYLGHGIFHPEAVLCFLQVSIWERSTVPNPGTSEEEWGNFIVARVFKILWFVADPEF